MYYTIIVIDYDTVSVLPLSPFLIIVTDVPGCIRLIIWAKRFLFGLFSKAENSHSVLLSVAHHQQYCKEQEVATEANFCSPAQSTWLLFYFMEAF